MARGNVTKSSWSLGAGLVWAPVCRGQFLLPASSVARLEVWHPSSSWGGAQAHGWNQSLSPELVAPPLMDGLGLCWLSRGGDKKTELHL